MGVYNCSMLCCTLLLLYIHSSFAIILMGKRELVALLSLSSWCLVMDMWLFLAVPWVRLQFVIVVFPDHTHLLFIIALSTGNTENRSYNSRMSLITGFIIIRFDIYYKGIAYYFLVLVNLVEKRTRVGSIFIMALLGH